MVTSSNHTDIFRKSLKGRGRENFSLIPLGPRNFRHGLNCVGVVNQNCIVIVRTTIFVYWDLGGSLGGKEGDGSC